MQSLITLLLQLSGKAWTVIVVTVLCGGAVTVTLSAGRVSAIGFFSALAVAIRAEEGFKAKTATVASGGLCASG